MQETRLTPYAFTGPYAHCYINPGMAMDPRHVYIIHEILRAWTFRNVLELGSFCGASSTAFIEAINRGSGFVATFCDFDLRESLHDVLSNCESPERCRFIQGASWDVLALDEIFDLVLVDANHDVESVSRELRVLVPRHPLCVMAHDTNATATGYPAAEGARLLKETFQSMPEYRCIEDAKHREGEETHRGLFFATTDEGLFRVAQKAFEKWA